MMELSLLTYCPVKGWLQPRRLLMNSCLLTNMAIFRIVQLNNAVYFNLYMGSQHDKGTTPHSATNLVLWFTLRRLFLILASQFSVLVRPLGHKYDQRALAGPVCQKIMKDLDYLKQQSKNDRG